MKKSSNTEVDFKKSITYITLISVYLIIKANFDNDPLIILSRLKSVTIKSVNEVNEKKSNTSVIKYETQR